MLANHQINNCRGRCMYYCACCPCTLDQVVTGALTFIIIVGLALCVYSAQALMDGAQRVEPCQRYLQLAQCDTTTAGFINRTAVVESAYNGKGDILTHLFAACAPELLTLEFHSCEIVRPIIVNNWHDRLSFFKWGFPIGLCMTVIAFHIITFKNRC